MRARIRLKALKGSEGETLETVALINASFESEEPEAVIPVKLAEELGLWPQLPNGTEIEVYEVAGGGKVRIYRIVDCLETRVITEDESSDPIKTVATIMEREREVVFSDKATSANQMELEDVGAGIWKFKGETKSRESEGPEFW